MIKILIADDHPMIRKRIGQILREESDLEICCEASGGLEALDLLEKRDADLVILDLNMPDMSGLETLTRIRSLYPNLPVVMLTALSEGMYSAKALKVGVSGFISKESAGEELVKTIRQIIEKNKNNGERTTHGKPL